MEGMTLPIKHEWLTGIGDSILPDEKPSCPGFCWKEA